MASNFEPSTFEQACIEARRWIEEVTELCFPYEDFRNSLRDGVLLCKLAEKLSGINIGELSSIPRSLAWMDNLTIFLNVCHYMGMKKSQLFHVDDLVAVRNQDLPLKTKQKEESRRIRNVLITIFWLGKLAYSLKNYQGPLPDLNSFENLINKRRPPEMVDQRRNKFELDTLSGSDTWPRFKRSSKPSRSSRVNEGSLEYFEQMRHELIPHLSALVLEKTSMYDRIHREAKQEEIYSKGKDRRTRSVTNPLAGRGFPDKARRAYSSGTLAAVNDERTNKTKVERYYTAGSITRRTPIKEVQPAVVQKEIAVQHGKSQIVSMSGVKHRSGQSFQYDKQPVVNEQRKITNLGAHASKYKSTKKNESVSVTTLIQQWSTAEGKVDKQDKTSDSASTNRRSLPANFATNSNLPTDDESELRRTKSVSTYMYDKTQADYPAKTSGLQSDKIESRSTGHTKITRRKSEPVKIYTNSDRSIHPPPETKKEGADSNERSSWYQNETAKNEKWMSQDIKRYPPNSSFQPSSEKERDRFREIQSEYHRPKESVMDRNAIGKYATMPIRQRKPDQNQSIKKNETNKAERGFENKEDDLIGDNSKDTQKYENNADLSHASGNRRLQKKKHSFRHLPSYEEAIQPLHETEVSEETTGGKQEKLRIERSSTTSAPHHFISPKESSNGKTKELRNQETKQPIQENVVKQHVLEAKTVPELDSLFSVNNLEKEATQRSEKFVNRDNEHEGLGVQVVSKSVGHYNSVTSQSESIKSSSSVIKSSNLMTQSSHSKSKTDGVKEVSSNRDINNNLSTTYDNQLQKTVLAPRQRRRESASSRAEDKKRRNDGSSSQESRHVKIIEVKALKEQERLRQQQKIILDEDFKQRGSSSMTPDVVQQLTKQEGMSFSNVVHDKELVELVAAEEKYWKEKIEKKDQVCEDGKNTNEKQQRIDEMLREFKLQDRKNSTPAGYSEMTDTLRAEEEFLAQEAEKLLKLRFQEKSVKNPLGTSNLSQVDGKCEYETSSNDDRKLIKSSMKYNLTGPLLEETKQTYDNVNMNTDSPRSPVTTAIPPTSKKSSSTSSDDIKLQPEADQAYHNQPRRISRSKTPVYMCSGCRLPVQRDICLFVSELQSYWHEKCFRCSVCQSNLIRGRSTPKIRVMFSQIHCENCLSNKKTGGRSTMV